MLQVALNLAQEKDLSHIVSHHFLMSLTGMHNLT